MTWVGGPRSPSAGIEESFEMFAIRHEWHERMLCLLGTLRAP